MLYFYTSLQVPQVSDEIWDFTLDNNTYKPTFPVLEFRTALSTMETIDDASRHSLATLIKSNREQIQAIPKHYKTFLIPKANGGNRTITAPNDELKFQQRMLLNALHRALPHNAVHSYVSGRSAKTAMLVHQIAEHRWYLNLDIKDFFPSLTRKIVMRGLRQQVSLSHLRYTLYQIAQLAFLDGVLPQGAPTSPMLSNLALYEFDYKLTQLAENSAITYTRYADDLVLSSNDKAALVAIQDKITELLNPLGLKLNESKTKLRSHAGRNFHLGLIVNQNNDLTVGYRKKREIKQKLYQVLKKQHMGVPEEELEKEAQEVEGLLAHLHSVEPDYASHLLTKYGKMFTL